MTDWCWHSGIERYVIWVPTENLWVTQDGVRLPPEYQLDGRREWDFHHTRSSLASRGSARPTFLSHPPGYKYQSDGFFKFGKVFKILWPEIGDSHIRTVTEASQSLIGKVAAKVRWFVIIRAETGFSSCLPIQTYGGRGVAKRSLIKAHHAIIHASNNAPTETIAEYPNYATGEEGMKTPIRVKLKRRNDRMDPMSRVNFVKMYTVEHNVKAYEVGDVSSESASRLVKDFNECWETMSAYQTDEDLQDSDQDDDNDAEHDADDARNGEL